MTQVALSAFSVEYFAPIHAQSNLLNSQGELTMRTRYVRERKLGK